MYSLIFVNYNFGVARSSGGTERQVVGHSMSEFGKVTLWNRLPESLDSIPIEPRKQSTVRFSEEQMSQSMLSSDCKDIVERVCRTRVWRNHPTSFELPPVPIGIMIERNILTRKARAVTATVPAPGWLAASARLRVLRSLQYAPID